MGPTRKDWHITQQIFWFLPNDPHPHRHPLSHTFPPCLLPCLHHAKPVAPRNRDFKGRPEDELRMRTLAPKSLNHPKSSMFQCLHVAELPKLDPGRATGATLSVELPCHRLATLALVHCSKTLKTQKIWLWKDHVPVGKHHKSHVSSGIKAGAPGRFPKIISRIKKKTAHAKAHVFPKTPSLRGHDVFFSDWDEPYGPTVIF